MIETPERLLNSAEALFAKQGYAGTTTRQIASAAGISIQTLHYHYENKVNLYSQVMKRSLVPLIAMINGHIEQIMAEDMNDDKVMQDFLDKLIDEIVDVLHQNPNLPLLLFRQWMERDPSLRQVEWEQLVPFLRKWIQGAEAKVDAERRRGIDLPLSLISLSFIYWGLFSNPVFIGKFIDLDPDSPEYFERLRNHMKEVSSRILGRRNEVRSSIRKG